ncbi:unnamed protein product, partial [Cyprideis torosa]
MSSLRNVRCAVRSIRPCPGGPERPASVHRIPKAPHLRQKWLDALRWPDHVPVPSPAEVCSKHFETGDIILVNRRHVLRTADVTPFQHVDHVVSDDFKTTTGLVKHFIPVPKDILEKEPYFSDDPEDFILGVNGKRYRRIYYIEVEESSVPFPHSSLPDNENPLNSTMISDVGTEIPELELSWIAPSEVSLEVEEEEPAEMEDAPKCVIVEWTQMVALFRTLRCQNPNCCKPIVKSEKSRKAEGAAFSMTFTCVQGHKWSWASSQKTGSYFSLNVSLSAAILVCGGSNTTVSEIADTLGLAFPHTNTLIRHQTAFVNPTIETFYDKCQS